MSDDYNQVITTFPLFSGYTQHGAAMVRNQGTIRACKPGDVLFREGDLPSVVLLVLKGRLEVLIQREGKDFVLTTSEPGSVVGELAVLCNIPRAATVRALEDSVILQWEADAFRRMLLGDANLSQRIFRQSLKTLIEKEQSMIESLMQGKGSRW